MPNLLQFITNVRKSHCQPQCTVQLAGEDRVFFFFESSIQNTSEQFVSGIHLYFVNFSLRATPQTKLFIRQIYNGSNHIKIKFTLTLVSRVTANLLDMCRTSQVKHLNNHQRRHFAFIFCHLWKGRIKFLNIREYMYFIRMLHVKQCICAERMQS